MYRWLIRLFRSSNRPKEVHFVCTSTSYEPLLNKYHTRSAKPVQFVKQDHKGKLELEYDNDDE